MKIATIMAVTAAFLAVPATALALGYEKLGNAPVVKQPEWADGVLGVVNLESRIYSQWVNGNENFFFQGDTRALNEALRKYAAVKGDERRLVLLPGRGKTQQFGGKPVDFDWKFHVPSGIFKAFTGSKNAVMTVYVNAAKPKGRPDRKRIADLIGDLENDSFEKRQKAERELQALGDNAKPFLRETLKARRGLELTKRVERLLKRLPGFDAGDLEIPKGLTLITAGDLLDTHLKGLSNTDPTRCGMAIYGLCELAPSSNKVVPALAGMLGKDKNEYVRRVAASCLGHLGVPARSALQALKDGLGDPDKNVSAAFQAAVQQIEKAKDDPERDKEVKRRLAILKDLNELKKSGGK